MAEFGKISWGPKTSDQAQLPKKNTDENLFDTFCSIAQEKVPGTHLLNQFKVLREEMTQLKANYEKFVDAIATTPFISSFLLWVGEVSKNFDIAKALVQNDFIGTYDNSGNVWTMKDAKNFDHQKILSAIRCRREWTIRRRETAVSAYIDFMNWLSSATYGYMTGLIDQDSIAVSNRLLSFPKFLDFLDALPNEKSQLVAKLLYFGGNRTLDPVLNLTIESVNFDQLYVTWEQSSNVTYYPEHVFNDIKALIDNRRQGKIFLSSQNQLLSEATIFRHFNEASKKTSGSSFGPKKLTTNKL